MMRYVIPLLLASVSFAHAQQQQQQQSTAIDRISGSLAQCISKAEQQFDENAKLRAQVTQLLEQLKNAGKDVPKSDVK